MEVCMLDRSDGRLDRWRVPLDRRYAESRYLPCLDRRMDRWNCLLGLILNSHNLQRNGAGWRGLPSNSQSKHSRGGPISLAEA